MITYGEIISAERKKQHLSQKDLANELRKYGVNVTQKAISKWEKNITEANTTQFLTVCQILGIRDIQSTFLGGDQENPFSLLNNEGKEKAIEYMNLLLLSDDYRLDKEATVVPRLITQKIYQLPVSAGTGEFLDSDAYDEIEIAENMVPDGADFGVRIHGDSMEPQFVNDQIVWIHRQETLHSGEIGIFYLDGNAFCKKFLAKRGAVVSLLSLNKKYAPIIITEASEFRVFGKVL